MILKCVLLPTPHMVGQKCVNDVKNELLRTRSDMVRDSGLNTRLLLVLCRLLNISNCKSDQIGHMNKFWPGHCQYNVFEYSLYTFSYKKLHGVLSECL